MIEIKSTKALPREDDPQQRYATKGLDAKSKTPVYITLLLAAVGLYLKSIFPSLSKPHDALPEASPPAPESENLQVATSDVPASAVETPVQDQKKTGSGTSADLLDLPRTPSFTMIESQAFQFADPLPRIDWFSPRTTSLRPLAANDNPRGGNGSSGAGGGSHSGGGASPPNGEGSGPPDDGGTGPGPDPDPGPGGDPGPGDDTDPDDGDNNRAPRLSGPVYLMDVVGCATLAIGLNDLLANAADPDNDVLSIQNLAVSTGTLSAIDDGWVFEPGSYELGPVVISYQVTDGQFAVDQFAYFSIVEAAPILGKSGADMLLGTNCADEIDGAGGDDVIDAGAGSDTISGGSGDDHIVAGDGHDVVFGGSGNDIVFAGAGNDHVSGGAGNDRLFGEAGHDVLFGDEGNDLISGGEGNDRLFGGAGDDAVYGGEGDDTLDGGTGADSLFGDAGNDRIDGGDGDDRIEGGDGNDIVLDGAGEDEVLAGGGDDHVVAALDGSNDIYDGGDGFDVLDYSAATAALTINLVAGTASGVEIGDDCFESFEKVRSGSGDDHLIIGFEGVAVTGGDGRDTFEFSFATDVTGLPPARSFQPVEITDFQIGDRLRIKNNDLFEEMLGKVEDQFEKIYGDGIDEDSVRLRYSNDRSETMGRKVVEADFDRDGHWETTIEVDGQLVVVTIESV